MNRIAQVGEQKSNPQKKSKSLDWAHFQNLILIVFNRLEDDILNREFLRNLLRTWPVLSKQENLWAMV